MYFWGNQDGKHQSSMPLHLWLIDNSKTVFAKIKGIKIKLKKIPQSIADCISKHDSHNHQPLRCSHLLTQTKPSMKNDHIFVERFDENRNLLFYLNVRHKTICLANEINPYEIDEIRLCLDNLLANLATLTSLITRSLITIT